jgi:hypothetical protein
MRDSGPIPRLAGLRPHEAEALFAPQIMRQRGREATIFVSGLIVKPCAANHSIPDCVSEGMGGGPARDAGFWRTGPQGRLPPCERASRAARDREIGLRSRHCGCAGRRTPRRKSTAYLPGSSADHAQRSRWRVARARAGPAPASAFRRQRPLGDAHEMSEPAHRSPGRSLWHGPPQLLEPGRRGGITRGAPVPARRERAAGAHLGTVRQGRALELA